MGLIDWYLSRATRSLGSQLTGNNSSMFGQVWYPEEEAQDPELYLATSLGVYVSARYRSQKLAALPLRFYTGTGDRKKLVSDGSIIELFSKVNPYWTARRLMEMTELSLCIWGKNFWFMSLKANGEPEEIWWVKPTQVKVIRSADDYISHFEYDIGSGQPLQFSKEETFWLRYPNPIDQFDGLAPLLTATLSADIGTAGLKSNAKIFSQGMQMAGFVSPPEGVTWSKETGDQIESDLKRRFSGANKSHRWAVLSKTMRFEALSLSPKDAEYLAAIKMSFEDIGRAYGISPDLLGGDKTYANAAEARLAFWQDTMMPEAAFIADEITEQILPLFKQKVDIAEFDLGEIDVLQEVKAARWARWKEQIALGSRTIDEERLESGLAKVPWGSVYWKPLGLEPVATKDQVDNWQEAHQPAPAPAPMPLGEPTPTPALGSGMPEETPPSNEAPRGQLPAGDTTNAHMLRALRRDYLAKVKVYGSPEHKQAWRALVNKSQPWENKLGREVEEFFRRQKKSIIAKLNDERAMRDIDPEQPFDLQRWIKALRETSRPIIKKVVEDTGQEAIEAVQVDLVFDVDNTAVARYIENRAQTFAKHVNETTFDKLSSSLAEGILNGDTRELLIQRVEAVMSMRSRAASEVIARTEIISAMNGSTLEAWKQSDSIVGKVWLAALDDRVRPTHEEAHGQQVRIDDDFIVGDGSGPCPGSIGLPEEDVACRCSMTGVLDTDWHD